MCPETSTTYGEITMHSMTSLLEYMNEISPLTKDSVFLDIGSGLGKPQLLAAAKFGCIARGVECVKSRVTVANKFKERLADKGVPKAVLERVQFEHVDAAVQGSYIIEGVPPTHIYSFCARINKGDIYQIV